MAALGDFLSSPLGFFMNPLIGQGAVAGKGILGALTPQLPEVVPPSVPAEIASPKAMPTPNDDAQRRAKRRSLAEQMARRGRASTILTSDDGLGG